MSLISHRFLSKFNTIVQDNSKMVKYNKKTEGSGSIALIMLDFASFVGGKSINLRMPGVKLIK